MARNSITLTHVGDSMMCLKQGVLLVKGSLSMGDSTSKKERSKLQQYARTRIQQFGVHHYRTTNLVSGLNSQPIFAPKVSKEALLINVPEPGSSSLEYTIAGRQTVNHLLLQRRQKKRNEKDYNPKKLLFLVSQIRNYRTMNLVSEY